VISSFPTHVNMIPSQFLKLADLLLLFLQMLSASDFPPVPNLLVPIRQEFAEQEEEAERSFELQLHEVASRHEHGMRGVSSPTSEIDIAKTVLFYETPEEKFEARLPIINRGDKLLTYAVNHTKLTGTSFL